MGIVNYSYNRSTSGGEIIRELVNSTDGQGLHFDGAAGNIDIASPPDLGTKFSFELIIQADDWVNSSSQQFLVDFYAVGKRILFGSASTSTDYLGLFVGAAWEDFGVKVLDDNKPHHLVVTVDGDAAILYDNGNQVGTLEAAASADVTGCTTLKIGSRHNGSYWFNGTIYRARFWNKTLKPAEVTTAYENATVPFADQYGSQTTINSGTTTSGLRYRITARDGVDFTTVGAEDNNVGTEFIATGAVTLDANDTVVRIGCVADYDLAFANQKQSLVVEDRSGSKTDAPAGVNATGMMSASGVTQVTPIEQLNAKALSIGTSAVTPADGEIRAVKAIINSGASSDTVSIEAATDCIAQINAAHATGEAVLELKNSVDDANTWRVQRAHAGSFEVKDQSAGATRLTIDSAGNVGIGVAAPDKTLELKTDADTATAAIKIIDSSDSTATYLGQFADNTYLTNNTTYASGWAADNAALGVAHVVVGSGAVEIGTAAAGTAAPAARLTIDSTGLATFSNGISFGDETLDEYDEGTWTVGFHDAAAAGNASSTTATGYYTRIGRLVTVSFGVFDINISGMTGGNQMFFTLPFAVSAIPAWGTATTRDVEWTSGTMVSCAFGASTQRGSFIAAQDNGAWSYPTVTDFSGTGDVYVTGVYMI